MGGAIFNFSQNIGLKTTKNVRFCILHKPMKLTTKAPPPPLATLLYTTTINGVRKEMNKHLIDAEIRYREFKMSKLGLAYYRLYFRRTTVDHNASKIVLVIGVAHKHSFYFCRQRDQKDKKALLLTTTLIA